MAIWGGIPHTGAGDRDALVGAHVPPVRCFSAATSALQLSENRTVYRR